MSLQLNFDLCVVNSCSQLRFNECTGYYSTANPTGWGTPNPNVLLATSATLDITGPDNITHTVDLFATTLFPTNNTLFEYDIPLSSIGSPSTITDGQWKFLYTVVADGATYTREIYKYFYCNSECCVTGMQPTVTTCDCCDKNESYNNYITAWTFLQSLKDAAKCGDYTNFTNIKKIVDKLCLNSGCKTCK